ncbi:hypothetical protein K3495_g2924, partial [Podosphaera aphanis]
MVEQPRLRQAALRIHRLDRRHPLRRRAEWTLQYRRRISRFSAGILSLPEVEFIDPLILPPWHNQEGWRASIKRVTRSPFRGSGEIPFQDLVAYADGSRSESDSGPQVGAGVVVMQADRVILRRLIPLSPTLEIFDAEATAVLHALELTLTLPSTRFANNLWILTDNLEVARRLLSSPVCSSQKLFLDFTNKTAAWPQRVRLPHTIPGKIEVRWIPSHAGIRGNILADQAAKEAM